MGLFYDFETYQGLKGSNLSSYSYPRQWDMFVEDIKKLYADSNYKRCLNQCEKMLQDHSSKVLSHLLVSTLLTRPSYTVFTRPFFTSM